MASYTTWVNAPASSDYRQENGMRINKVPQPVNSKFMRTVYREIKCDHNPLGGKTDGGVTIIKKSLGHVRAQLAWLVTILEFSSEFQIEPTQREFYIFAPYDPVSRTGAATKHAIALWQRVFGPKKDENGFPDEYPRIENTIVAELMEDDEFDAHWKDVKNRPHRAFGDPEDPYAFVCLDVGVKLYRGTDRLLDGFNSNIKL